MNLWIHIYIYITVYINILYMWIFGSPCPGNLRHIDDHTACDGTGESSTSWFRKSFYWLTMKIMGENPVNMKSRKPILDDLHSCLLSAIFHQTQCFTRSAITS